MESFRGRFEAILPVVLLIKEKEAPNSGNESHYGGIRKNSKNSKNENNNEKLNKHIEVRVMKRQLTKLKM